MKLYNVYSDYKLISKNLPQAPMALIASSRKRTECGGTRSGNKFCISLGKNGSNASPKFSQNISSA